MKSIFARTFLASFTLATLASAPREPVKTQIVTFPPGAAIAVNGRYLGVAPVTVALPRAEPGAVSRATRIEAEPRVAGQYFQVRELAGTDTNSLIPARLMIDMTIPTAQTNSASFDLDKRPKRTTKSAGSAKGVHARRQQSGKH